MAADRLGAATQRAEHPRIHAEGVRRYQQELSWRSTSVRIARVREGWWHGPAPYGYQLSTRQLTDSPDHAGIRHRLVIDEQRAGTVPLIFTWFVRDGLGHAAIAARLAADTDRYRPPARPAGTRAWPPARIRAILTNPAYLGYVVYGRTRQGRAQIEDRWIWSWQPSHPPLVEETLWWAARDKLYPQTRPTDTSGLSPNTSETRETPQTPEGPKAETA
jgi:hypothetical protein